MLKIKYLILKKIIENLKLLDVLLSDFYYLKNNVINEFMINIYKKDAYL